MTIDPGAVTNDKQRHIWTPLKNQPIVSWLHMNRNDYLFLLPYIDIGKKQVVLTYMSLLVLICYVLCSALNLYENLLHADDYFSMG